MEFGFELYTASGKMSVKRPTKNELIDKADNWLSKNKDKIRDALSKDSRIRTLAKSKKNHDLGKIVALIFDALTLKFTGFPLMTLATLIAKYYLDHYLDPTTEDQENNDVTD